MKIPKNLSVQVGKNQYLLSAPHSYKHVRNEIDVKVRQEEEWTDYIAQTIATSSISNLICARDQLDYDPNYLRGSENVYKEVVAQMVKMQNVRYCLDIHGLCDTYNYDIAIFYKNKYIKSKKLAYDLGEFLRTHTYSDAIIFVLNFPLDNDRETISEYCCERLRIASVQIEIAKYIRADDFLRSELIERMSEFALSY